MGDVASELRYVVTTDRDEWMHESFGTNWRMTEMQAAIGRVQLRKLPQWLTLRRRNAGVLTDGFSRIPGLRLTIPPQEIEHAYYKYYVFVEPEALKTDWSRDRIMTALMAEGIPCGSGSCSEIYLEKAFRDRGHPSEMRFARHSREFHGVKWSGVRKRGCRLRRSWERHL